MITSQNDTAPKHSRQRYYGPSREALEAGGGPPRRDSREPTAAEDGGLRGTVANLHTDSDLTPGSYAGGRQLGVCKTGIEPQASGSLRQDTSSPKRIPFAHDLKHERLSWPKGLEEPLSVTSSYDGTATSGRWRPPSRYRLSCPSRPPCRRG